MMKLHLERSCLKQINITWKTMIWISLKKNCHQSNKFPWEASPNMHPLGPQKRITCHERFTRSQSNFSSQKVVRCSASDMWLSSSRCWVKLKEWILQCIIKFHDCSLISTSVAVVWSTKYRNYIPIMTPVVTLHNKLMSSCNKSQAICVIKSFWYILSKGVSSTTWWNTPTTPIIWVTP